MKWVGRVAQLGRRQMNIGGKTRRKKPLRRPRRRWMDNIKIDLREIGWGGSIWLRIGTSGRIL
jgi:hypothetical protein